MSTDTSLESMKRISLKQLEEEDEEEEVKKLDLKDLNGCKLFTIEEENSSYEFEEVDDEISIATSKLLNKRSEEGFY